LPLSVLLTHKQSILSISNKPRAIEQVLVISSPIVSESSEIQNTLVDKILNIEHSDVSIQGYIPNKLVTPRYPRHARQRGVEGIVDVSFSIDINGEVKDPIIIRSQPQGIFDRAVLNALKDFRFEPPSINGQAVEIQAVGERFVFTIETDPHVRKRRQH